MIEKVPGGTGRYLSYFGKVTGGIERYHEVLDALAKEVYSTINN